MDITNRRLLYVKALLFVLGGLLASAAVLVESRSLRVAFLHAVGVWCFARAYYFAFYVVQHYADGRHRFSGLWSFVGYLCRRPRPPVGPQRYDQPGTPSARPTEDKSSN